MRDRAFAFAFLVFGLFLTTATADEPIVGGGAGEPPVTSGVKLDVPTSTLIEKTTGTYKIVATGKVSLAKGETWGGFKMEFKDKNGNTPTPTLTQFTIPAPGESKTFSYYLTTTTVGGWTIQATMDTTTPVKVYSDPKLITLP